MSHDTNITDGVTSTKTTTQPPKSQAWPRHSTSMLRMCSHGLKGHINEFAARQQISGFSGEDYRGDNV